MDTQIVGLAGEAGRAAYASLLGLLRSDASLVFPPSQFGRMRLEGVAATRLVPTPAFKSDCEGARGGCLAALAASLQNPLAALAAPPARRPQLALWWRSLTAPAHPHAAGQRPKLTAVQAWGPTTAQATATGGVGQTYREASTAAA